MGENEQNRVSYWVNVSVVLPSLLLAGATIAAIHLLVPVLFAIIVAAYTLKFSFEICAWHKIKAEDRSKYREPCRFMNYNSVMSVKMEWFLFGTGFMAFFLWMKFGPSISG